MNATTPSLHDALAHADLLFGRAELETALQTRLPTAIEAPPLLRSPNSAKEIFLIRRTSRPGNPARLNGLVLAGLDIGRWLHASRNMNPDRRPMATIDLLELHNGQAPIWLGSTADSTLESPLANWSALPPLAVVRPLLAFGKTFALVARPTPDFMHLSMETSTWLLALVGLVLTASVAWMFGLFANRRENLARLLDERSRALARSMHHYSLLAKQNRVVTWELDTAGLYVDISDMCETVVGYRPEEMVGKMHFYDLCPEPDRDEFKREFDKSRGKKGK